MTSSPKVGDISLESDNFKVIFLFNLLGLFLTNLFMIGEILELLLDSTFTRRFLGKFLLRLGVDVT